MLIYTKKSKVYLDVSNQKNRVQEIRLFASLIEAGWNLEVNKDQLSALSFIKKIKKGDTSNKNKINLEISVDHSKPITSIDKISSELIFPEWFFNNYENEKKDLIIFEGLVTQQRIKYLVELLDYGILREKLCILIYKISKNYGRF
jgi:hypothetical protein